MDFEPIYRVVENVDPKEFCDGFVSYLENAGATVTRGSCDAEGALHFTLAYGASSEPISVESPPYSLAVACAQEYIDRRIANDASITTDYIHGEDEVFEIASHPGCVGILFDSITKHTLFSSVETAGVLPRKTFSMGHANDKRYYTEARRIRKF